MRRRSTTHILVAALLFVSLPAAADPVEDAEHAYRSGNYAVAIDYLSNIDGLLAVAPLFDRIRGEERERVLFDLARCRVAAGDSSGARVVLGELFRNDPRQSRGNLDVGKDDALQTVLDELRRLRRARQQARINATSPIKAALRSLVLPGWGQRYRGHGRRGNMISAAAGGLAAGLFLADRAYRSALDTYRNTSELDLNLPARTGGPDDPNPFADRFKRVESRASTARAVGVALAAVWIYGITENFVIAPGRVALIVPLD